MKNTAKHLLFLCLIYIVIQVVYLINEYLITGHHFGVPLDDVWIHFRYAENFAKGYFFQYNIGEPTPGTTSPFWVIILSVPFLLSQNFILPFALFVSSLFFLLTLIELYKLCLKIGFEPNYSFLITLLTMLCGRLLWSSLSGMEITLFCWLSVLIFKNHISEIEQNKIYKSTGLLLGLAAVTRPEAYLLALIYFSISIIIFWKAFKANFTNFSVSLIIFILIILPYPVFCYIHTGGFLPNTYKGQINELEFSAHFQFLNETAKYFIKDNLIILTLWIVSSAYFIYSLIKKRAQKKLLFVNFWITLLPLISALIAYNWRHHGRYLIPLIPFINITAINILLKIFSKYKEKNFARYNLYMKIFITAILILSLNSCILFSRVTGWNVENINDQQCNIGYWLNKNLPDEKAFGLNDIGAITYITKKPIVDMAGLVTPEIFRFQKMSYEEGSRSLLKLLKEKNVNYIIIYPDWYKYIMEHYSSAFQQVYSAKLENNTICGGVEMFVYKINWAQIELK